MTADGVDRAPRVPWLPLIRRLTELSSDWGIWKNSDSALEGGGDIDSVAPRRDLMVVMSAFHNWASEHHFTPVFACTHVPGVVLVVGLSPDHELIELDLCERQPFRGSELFRASDLSPMMRMDPRGFRRLRSGAEGLLLLFLQGMRYGGRPRWDIVRHKGIGQLLASDREGALLAADLFGLTKTSAARLGRAVAEGRWDRASAMRVETWSSLRALVNPGLLWSRLRFRRVQAKRCALWPALVRGRRVDGDVERWLARMRENHKEIHG